MRNERKTSQLQIRISPAQKAAIRRNAKRAGMGMSDWVLSQLLPEGRETFQEIVSELAASEETNYPLAELNDLLTSLTPDEYRHAVCDRPEARLTPQCENYVAAMVEQAATKKGTKPPAWTLDVPPLNEPFFGSSVPALRLHLMVNSPPPFHRRNIFVDSSIGDRV
jgi:uncharacterized protein (DUF1778 family)